MRKFKKLLLITILFSVYSFAKNPPKSFSGLINAEVEEFISKVKVNSLKGGAYSVYTLNINQLDSGNYCFTIGVIDDLRWLKRISFTNVFWLGNEIVLVNLADGGRFKDSLSALGMEAVDSSNFHRIKAKLYFSETGGIVGTTPGLLYCVRDGEIVERFYENSDDMPFPIYERILLKGNVRLIYDPSTAPKQGGKDKR